MKGPPCPPLVNNLLVLWAFLFAVALHASRPRHHYIILATALFTRLGVKKRKELPIFSGFFFLFNFLSLGPFMWEVCFLSCVDEGKVVRVFGKEEGRVGEKRRKERGREINTCTTWIEMVRAVWHS